MAIKNAYRYNAVNGNQMLKDFRNEFRYVSQKVYKGSPDKTVPEGATVTLQILYDDSAPVLDKETGQPKEDNTLETFEATVVGVNYPLPFRKGDHVALSGFVADKSFYIDYKFILRFTGIKKLQPMQPGQVQSQHQGGKA